MIHIDNNECSRRTIEHRPSLSASASLRRLFAQPQPASSPYTPGSVMVLTQNIGLKLDEQEQNSKGERISMHIQSFFKNLSDTWHLQEEIDEQSNNSETDQEETDRNPTTSINKRDRRSEDEFSGYLYEEFTEELKDHSTMKKDKDSFYDSTSTKESHPFFDGRFVEVDGLIQYDPEWEERQLAKQKRRQRRRASAWGQNMVVNKAA